jgi:hypothetical protein
MTCLKPACKTCPLWELYQHNPRRGDCHNEPIFVDRAFDDFCSHHPGYLTWSEQEYLRRVAEETPPD